MRKIMTMVAAAMMAAMSLDVRAQHTPVGITSSLDSVNGVQVGILSSVAVGQMKGFQFGGFANMSAAPINGMQLSGVSNIATGVEKGVQLSPMFNISAGDMRGVQASLYNFADTLSGAQVGLFNRAVSQSKGWQVGLLNISRDTIGHQIGLFNINPKTTVDFMLFGGNASKANMAVRLRNRHHYSILGLGTHYMGLDRKFSGSVFYRLGLYRQLSPRWTISGDIGFAHVETFEEHSNEEPDRLYSLQARINADYQINRYLGAFASVGYGDTRYYSHNASYRHRPIFEAGLALRYNNRIRTAPVMKARDVIEDGDSLCPWPGKKKPWLAAAEVTSINVLVHCFDRFMLNEEFAQTTMNTIGDNFRRGFVWDNDFFITNMFAHPYHGNLYYNAARSNGMTFWQSVPYALGGSLMWEFFGETEPPAINDIFATTMGGVAIGEITHRLSNAVLDDSYRGWPRFFREALGLVINPVKGLNRIMTGEAWHVRSDNSRHHDWQRFPIGFAFSVGDRYLADDGALFRGEHNPYITLRMEYGDVLNEDYNNKPFDYFEAEVNLGLSKNQPLINRVHLLGRLWSTSMYSVKGLKGEIGIYQHFNYYDSEPVKDGTELTPYRIGEAASLGPGFVVQMPQVGALDKLEQRVFVSGILLGGTKSDYFNVLDRDYNMGSGYSVKSKTHIELKNFGRFITNISFFHIFTWKGYEDKDLSKYTDGTEDPHLLNAQGDRGNARLLVLNPMIEVDLGKNWGFALNSSYFVRRTHYKFYDDVKANTFEIKVGLSYHL